MSTLDRITRAMASGRRRATSPELDRAEIHVAAARERVEQLTKLIADDMRRGRPTPESRALLRTCQQILREMVIHRDALFVAFMKGLPTTEHDAPEPSASQASLPTEIQAGTRGSRE